jgi:hypothetical protein
VSIYALTDESWKLSPKEYGAVVHVYSNNDDLADGYKECFIHSQKRKKLSSAVIVAALEAASKNNLGTLGQGPLA